jgi:drug/metabolite transporter (DMT)-like permease
MPATLLAIAAIVVWSTLAVLSASLVHVPPLLSVGLALCISGLVSAVRWRAWRVPWFTFAVGVGGIFGYHFFYFSALQHAPAVEANLLNYLWPLLIVALSPVFLPGYRLHAYHWIGTLMGLAGTALILSGGRPHLDLANLYGYLLAAGAGLTWACYSLMTKRLPAFPTAAVGGFCLASGLLSLGAQALGGNPFSLSALSGRDWLALFLLGIGPMGAAFFLWDAALKGGDPRIIGSLAYLTPLLSTLNLVIFGGRTLSWVSLVAMALIVGGAAVGSLDLWKQSFVQTKILQE